MERNRGIEHEVHYSWHQLLYGWTKISAVLHRDRRSRRRHYCYYQMVAEDIETSEQAAVHMGWGNTQRKAGTAMSTAQPVSCSCHWSRYKDTSRYKDFQCGLGNFFAKKLCCQLIPDFQKLGSFSCCVLASQVQLCTHCHKPWYSSGPGKELCHSAIQGTRLQPWIGCPQWSNGPFFTWTIFNCFFDCNAEKTLQN